MKTLYNSRKEIRKHPWLTEEAIQFLEDFCKKKENLFVLEFGSGASTVWFSKHVQCITAIENHYKWYKFIEGKLQTDGNRDRVDYKLIRRPYYGVCKLYPSESFDLILVDGHDRVQCVRFAKRILKKGGILMLDNAERMSYANIPLELQDWPFYQTIQTKPDQYGFFEENWQTNWWVKPS